MGANGDRGLAGRLGKVWVHHAVEQVVLKQYPGLVTRSQMNPFENLPGNPNAVSSDIHLSQIRKEWNQFCRKSQEPGQWGDCG